MGHARFGNKLHKPACPPHNPSNPETGSTCLADRTNQQVPATLDRLPSTLFLFAFASRARENLPLVSSRNRFPNKNDFSEMLLSQNGVKIGKPDKHKTYASTEGFPTVLILFFLASPTRKSYQLVSSRKGSEE